MKGGLRARLLTYLEENADDTGLVREPIDGIRVKLGLNRHDAIKAVWDLKALGRLTFTEVRQGQQAYPDRITLRGRRAGTRAPRGDTVPALVLDWIGAHGGAEGQPVGASPKDLAVTLGVGYSTLMYNLNSMAGRGQLSLRYHGGGPRARVEAVSVPAWRPRTFPNVPGIALEETPVAKPAPVVKTPLLDAYRAAKAAADANPGNPYLHFDFVPIAEEALAALEGART